MQFFLFLFLQFGIIINMKLDEMPREFTEALPVIKKIEEAGFEAYFVGGSVRDVLLKRQIHDVDIATSAYPEETKAIFPSTIDVGIEHGTVLVLWGNTEAEHYEITTFRTESTYTDFRRPDQVDFVRDLSEDLKRRDFTINAFAMGADGHIIDLFNGLRDLDEHLIRAVGQAEERFNEDALRIMRAMRFSASLDFEIEEQTFFAMKSHAHLLSKISIERIFIELDKLLMSKAWKKGIEHLLRSEAYQFLPDFDNKAALESFLSSLGENYIFKSSEQAWAYLMIKLKIKDLRKCLRAWKVSNEFIKKVTGIVDSYYLEGWSLETVYRYGIQIGQLADDLKVGEGSQLSEPELLAVDAQLQIHDKSEIDISGAEIMGYFGLQPGPQLGKLLKLIEEKIVRNQLKNDKNEIKKMIGEELNVD